MAKYQKYAEYKDSGTQWLGDVPKHWLITTFKRVIKEHSGNGFPIELQGDESGVIPFLKVSDINGANKYSDRCNNRISKEALNKYGWNLVPNGSIVTGKIGEALRKNHRKILSEDSVIDNNCIGIEPIHLTENYNFYVHKVIDFDWYVNGGAIPSISVQKYKAEIIAIPNENEQTQIANFLDHETAQIDTLIAKQEKLIELLKEKRQAVISHAVTKGLNPNVPMKDSGVEWLGEVPEHWVITSIRNLIRSGNLVLQDGNHGELHPTANDYVEEGIPFLMANNIRAGKLLMGDVKRIPKHIADKLRIGFAKTGDMLLTHKGTVGEVALIPPEIQEEYWMLTPQVTYYRWNNQKFFNKYFYYQFQSTSIQNQLEIIGGKQSTRAYVGLIAQGDLIVVIPPKNEQIEIATNIFDKDQSYQVMIEKAESAIQLMQERRTVLISAAVTGKIDVRNWQHPNQKNNNNTELSA